MNKSAYPVFDMDVTKYMAQFRLPVFDVDALMAAQRRNFEALTAANQCAIEGVGALIRRQGEIARDTVEAYTQAVGELVGEGNAEDRAARQADLAKQTYERAVANARELADIAAKTQEEAFGFINARIREGFGEMKDIVAASTAQAAATVGKAADVAEQAGKTVAKK